MDIRVFQKLNARRALRWHNGDLNQWTLLEWCGAMAGEAGEACNAAKKLRRLALGLPNSESNEETVALQLKVAKEVADTIIYGLITLSVLDLDAAEVIADVFDLKSMEHGFPERSYSVLEP